MFGNVVCDDFDVVLWGDVYGHFGQWEFPLVSMEFCDVVGFVIRFVFSACWLWNEYVFSHVHFVVGFCGDSRWRFVRLVDGQGVYFACAFSVVFMCAFECRRSVVSCGPFAAPCAWMW